MEIYIKGHQFQYELEKLTRLFFPFEKITFYYDEDIAPSEFYAKTFVETKAERVYIYTLVALNGKTVEKEKHFIPGSSGDSNEARETEHKLAALLFECYFELTGYRPQWGILTGIRPAKLYRKFAAELGEDKVDEFFINEFLISPKKLSLLKETAVSEDNIIKKSAPDSVSIYVSIPFCPSRCSYCSFVSHSTEKSADLIPNYLEYLLKEIDGTANYVKKLGLKVLTVYVGGGTPTTLNANQLSLLLEKINTVFNGEFKELTVEAGRPDTITEEKLTAIFKGKATRISINPQTMNDSVLNKIGRRHTAKDTIDAFNLARKVGFKNINMDLIAGLPTDTFESFKDTLNKVLKLSPESVTIHSLSVKRSSKIGVKGDFSYIKDADVATKMVEYSNNLLKKNTINPYYMYRQSKTVGNLENVGYAKPGFEGLYNVYIMDETHTILACGASAVTKLKGHFDGAIERIFNYKYPYEYISGFNEILKRKTKVEEFYIEHPVSNQQ